MDSAFTAHRSEIDAIIIKTENGTRTQISKEDFCSTQEGQALLSSIEEVEDNKGTKLDVLLNFLELRHSRTDSGFNLRNARLNESYNSTALEYSAIYYRKAEVVLAKFVEECATHNVVFGILCPNESVMASKMKQNDYLRFKIPREVKNWTLARAMDEGITEDMRKGDMMELGELFNEPLIFITPRSEFNSQDPIQNGKMKQNWFCQVTIWKNKVHETNNMTINGVKFEPTNDHILEGLCPTSMAMDVRNGEELTRMNAPKKSKIDSKNVTEITVTTKGQNWETIKTEKLSYEWDDTVQFAAERKMMTRGMIVSEKTGLQERDDKVEVDIVRKIDTRIDKLKREITAIKV